MNETVLDAENRLNNMKSILLDKGLECSLIFSIENGIIPAGDHFLDIAVVLIENSEGERFLSSSCGLSFPKQYVEEAKSRGFYSNTVGSVIAEFLRCEPDDPHSAFTQNLFSRKKFLQDTVKLCLTQMPGHLTE